MTDAMLTRILAESEARKEDGGEYRLSEGRRLTLYAAHAGVALTVTRVEGIRLLEDGQLVARNDKGDRYFLSLGDVFGVAADGSTTTAANRKAGFLG